LIFLRISALCIPRLTEPNIAFLVAGDDGDEPLQHPEFESVDFLKFTSFAVK
jgi:hypothetical protein